MSPNPIGLQKLSVSSSLSSSTELITRTWDPSHSTSRWFFSPQWRPVLSEKGAKRLQCHSPGVRSCWEMGWAAPLLDILELRAFTHSTSCLSRYRLWRVGRWGVAALMATGISWCQNTEAFCLWTFNWDMVWNSHKDSLFQRDSRYFKSVMAQQFHHNIQLHYNWQGISLVACPKEIYDFLGNLLFFSWSVQHHSSRYKLFPFTTVRKWMLHSFTVRAFYSPCPIISDMIIFLLFAFHCKTQHKPEQRVPIILYFFYWSHIRSFNYLWDLMSVESPLRDQSRLDNHLANTHPNPKLSPQVAQAFKHNLALNFSSNPSLLGRASLSSGAGYSCQRIITWTLHFQRMVRKMSQKMCTFDVFILYTTLYLLMSSSKFSQWITFN